MKTRTAAAVALLGTLCAAAASATTQPGAILLVGGPPSTHTLAIVGEQLGRGDGICLLRSEARGDRSLRRLLSRAGLDTSIRLLDLDTRSGAELEDCRSLWLTGTDAAGTASGRGAWQETFLAHWRGGGSVVGFDAGAAALASRLVVAGTARRALGREPSDTRRWSHLDDGAGVVPGVLLEPRVWRRGRFGRLTAATLRSATPLLGLGLGEDNVVAVTGERVTVLTGAPIPLVIPADGADEEEGASRRAGGSLWLLGTGDHVDLVHRLSTRAPTKPPLWADTPGLRAPLRPWRGQKLGRLLERFAASTDRRLTLGRVDATRLRLDKPWHFRAHGNRDADDAFAGPFEIRLLAPPRR